MESLGVPSFVIPLIKGMSQVVTFETPDEPDGEWVMGTETGRKGILLHKLLISLTFIIADFGSKEERFIIGVEHAIPYGKLVVLPDNQPKKH